MNLRTTFDIEPSDRKITFETPVFFIGSCFASEMGSIMAEGKLDILSNPGGTVYNPVSIMNTIDLILGTRVISEADIYNHNGKYLSFLHYTNFTSDSLPELLGRINTSTLRANEFLGKSRFLFITFGTARVYRFRDTGTIVSNCHRIPASRFIQEMLTAEQVVSDWNDLLDRIASFNRDLRIIFTISPVRHWKDGAHLNQVSKSVLFVSVEKLLGHPIVHGYFPAYELVMDDLRDYRYYADDMLHPSQTAIEYIWRAFSDCYLDQHASALWKEIRNITKAMKHRFISDAPEARKDFAISIIKHISELSLKNPRLDFSAELAYFQDIVSG